MRATYLKLIDVAAERCRSGGWSWSDVYAFSAKLQDRFERLYGESL